jgi:hypothetical protein
MASEGGAESHEIFLQPAEAAAGDIACDPESADFNGGLGTATNRREKYLVHGGGSGGMRFPARPVLRRKEAVR